MSQIEGRLILRGNHEHVRSTHSRAVSGNLDDGKGRALEIEFDQIANQPTGRVDELVVGNICRTFDQSKAVSARRKGASTAAALQVVASDESFEAVLQFSNRGEGEGLPRDHVGSTVDFTVEGDHSDALVVDRDSNGDDLGVRGDCFSLPPEHDRRSSLMSRTRIRGPRSSRPTRTPLAAVAHELCRRCAMRLDLLAFNGNCVGKLRSCALESQAIPVVTGRRDAVGPERLRLSRAFARGCPQ